MFIFIDVYIIIFDVSYNLKNILTLFKLFIGKQEKYLIFKFFFSIPMLIIIHCIKMLRSLMEYLA